VEISRAIGSCPMKPPSDLQLHAALLLLRVSWFAGLHVALGVELNEPSVI
jgi:hypothetical protein